MDLTFYPVNLDRWSDFVELFESRGGPHYCWCTRWRTVDMQGKKSDKEEKKASMKARVNAGIPVGILAYLDQRPIAWCSVAPRDTYRLLGGDKTKTGVWSVACFFVCRTFRNTGISSRLLAAAIDYAKQNGARYVEAYPVDPDSPSYRFMGFRQVFERHYFVYLKRLGKRRHLMILDLKTSETSI
jgi:GNAT superfamily N-acetyltransferase